MLNNTYIFFGAILGLTIANVAGAATINMKNDRLSDLIQREIISVQMTLLKNLKINY